MAIRSGTCKLVLMLAATAGAVGACSTNPPQDVVEQMTRTQASIEQAQQSGAQQGALAELQLAKDKHTSAQQALDKRDYERALHLAQEAQVDAQYAAAKAQAEQAQAAAAQVQDSIRALRQEATRSATP